MADEGEAFAITLVCGRFNLKYVQEEIGRPNRKIAKHAWSTKTTIADLRPQHRRPGYHRKDGSGGIVWAKVIWNVADTSLAKGCRASKASAARALEGID